jgi:hypothetical protein
MNTTQLPGTIRGILTQPTGGVAGLVDNLLAVCLEHGLQLERDAGRCHFRSFGGCWEELTDVRLRKSAFRAVLARLAALCNERTPNSVSPHGRQGELSAGANPLALFRVSFTNTPAEQKLELTTLIVQAAEASPPDGWLEKSAGEADR